jgi:hypothetical protein
LAFQILRGNSRLYLPVLTPDLSSFLHILPTAFLNGFFEPLPGSGGQLIYIAFSIELIPIWLLLFYALIHLLRSRLRLNGFALFCLVFSLTGLLLIGYIIPFAGAIVRYRSIYLPFLLAPALNILRDQPLFQRLNKTLTRQLTGTPNLLITFF